MAEDYLLKQHLRLSPNARVKNLVPENLSAPPPESEWKLGRIWFNTTINKFEGIFLKVDPTGAPLVPEEWEVKIVGADELGQTKDGQYWPDGLFDFTPQTKISDAMDDVNEALKDLAPPDATLLRGNLTLTGQTLKSGRISSIDQTAPDTFRLTPTVNEGVSISYIVTNNNITSTLPTAGLTIKGVQQSQFGRADRGVMTVVMDDIPTDNGVDLFAQFNEPTRDYYGLVQGYDQPINQTFVDLEGNSQIIVANPNKSSYKSSSGSLTVSKVERYNDFKKWQRGTGSTKVTVTPGYHTIRVEHAGASGNPAEVLKTSNLEVFFDPNTTAPGTTITNLSFKTGTTKNISGVPYYTTGLSFSTTITALNAFNYTYWDTPISLQMSGTSVGNVSWQDARSNLNIRTVPKWDDQMTLTGYTINYTGTNTVTDNVVLYAKSGKAATGWGPQVSSTLNILIDTYPLTGNSNTLKETFLDEEYRIKIDLVDTNSVSSVSANTKGTWDSSVLLVSGEAQQSFGFLQKATLNYSSYYNNAVNYTSLSGVNQEYYRRFYPATNKPNSNGQLLVKTAGTIGTDFDMFIKFPSLTGWLDVNKLFDLQVFTLNKMVDGTGCATSISKAAGVYTIGWSIGGLSTVNSGYGYLVKVVLKTNTVKIDEIEESSTNWR